MHSILNTSRPLALLFAMCLALAAIRTTPALGLAFAAEKPWAAVELEGFKASYANVDTPKSEWSASKEVSWLTAVRGSFTSSKPISYRGTILAPGEYDLWVEKGKGEWYHLFLGDRENKEAPRLRTLFKLYEQDEGVDKLRIELKSIKGGSKVKISIFAGKSEGHSNFKIESSEIDSDE